MPYIGNQAATQFTSLAKQTVTGDGTTGPYTLDHAVANAQEIEVFVNNVRQEPGVAYTVAGDQMTMTGNVTSTDDFYVVFQGKALQSVVPQDDTVTTAKIQDDAVTTAKIADSAVNLTSKVTGILPVANGGTGSSSVYISRFALTSNLTADGTLTAWSAPALSNQVATIGTAVTASSGLFTFPVTGVWRVHLNARVVTTADGTLAAVIDITTDNGSNYTETAFASEGDGASTTNTGSLVLTEYVNVDDVSNVKVRFRGESIASGGYIQGMAVTNSLRTYVSFERITDAQ